MIEFTKERILKKYRATLAEEINGYNRPSLKSNNSINFEIEYYENKITLFMNYLENEEVYGYEKILEDANKAFDVIEYSLDNNGEIDAILNQSEIISKWNIIRKKILVETKDKMAINTLFGLSGRIENEAALLDILKRFFVIPYLFIGIHNFKFSKYSSCRKEGYLYNVFPFEDIPVIYEINEENENNSNNEKKIRLVGKVDPCFDRFAYIDKLKDEYRDNLPSLNNSANLSMAIDGSHIYNNDNTLNEMYYHAKVEISSLLKYSSKYEILSRDDENDEI
ncbi:MAG: hypothetical protein LBT51_04365 [Fusobacteriaceae bacterium]|jgi:hypothetical protein|nr:hypothetical protein [Fusobacteriaceae bacterium]